MLLLYCFFYHVLILVDAVPNRPRLDLLTGAFLVICKGHPRKEWNTVLRIAVAVVVVVVVVVVAVVVDDTHTHEGFAMVSARIRT